MTRNLRPFVLLVGSAMYAGSLFAPAIVFEATARSNPKRYECEPAAHDGMFCWAFRFGAQQGEQRCSPSYMPGKTYVDRAKILDYCQGWELPVARVLYGREVLLVGVLGAHIGMFAWFANLLVLPGLLLSWFGPRRASIIVLACSVALGLQSYALGAAPYDLNAIGTVDRGVVDHLGLGFYLWMGSLVAFTAYSYLRKNAGAVSARVAESPRAS